MKRLSFVTLALAASLALADVVFKQEGVRVGPALYVDCRGGVNCARDGSAVYLTTDAGRTALGFYEEGTLTGAATTLNCVGNGVSCTFDGGHGTLTVGTTRTWGSLLGPCTTNGSCTMVASGATSITRTSHGTFTVALSPSRPDAGYSLTVNAVSLPAGGIPICLAPQDFWATNSFAVQCNFAEPDASVRIPVDVPFSFHLMDVVL